MEGLSTGTAAGRWLLLIGAVLAVIVVPFLLFGAEIEEWTKGFTEGAANRPFLAAAVLGGLLASDIVFPVPSSLASTAAGLLLGFIAGAATSMAGMTVSCAAGFWIGRGCQRPVISRFMGETELRRLSNLSDRFGSWAIVISRPVPVLAEASTVFAGMSGMTAGRFFLLTALSNLGISAVYAAVGAFSAEVNSFLIAFAFSMLVPGVAMLVGRKTPRMSRMGTAGGGAGEGLTEGNGDNESRKEG